MHACEGVSRDPRLRFRCCLVPNGKKDLIGFEQSSGSFTPNVFPRKYSSASAQNPTKHRLIQTTMHVMSLAPSSLPAPQIGYIFLVASALLLAMGTHAILFSALFPREQAVAGLGTGEEDQLWSLIGITTTTTNNTTTIAVFVDALARDTHYKYLALFSVPVCAYFVIANWVGWQFFRNS
jgi:hypothetical protein